MLAVYESKTWTQQKKEKSISDRDKNIEELIEQWDAHIKYLLKRKMRQPQHLTRVFIDRCKGFGITIRTLKKIVKAKHENLWPECIFEYPYDFVLNEPSLLSYKRAENIENRLGLNVSIEKKIEAWTNYIFQDSSHFSSYKIQKKVGKENFSKEERDEIDGNLVKTKTKIECQKNSGFWEYYYTSNKIIEKEKNIEKIIRNLSSKDTNYNIGGPEMKTITECIKNGGLNRLQRITVKTFFGMLQKNKKKGKHGIGPNIFGLTGGPGTGKSFTLKKIIEIEKIINPSSRILGCALSGMAVNALTKSTDSKITCQTLHKSIIYGYRQIMDKRMKAKEIAEELDCDYHDVYNFYKKHGKKWPKVVEEIFMDCESENYKEIDFHYDLVFIDEITMPNILLLEDVLKKLVKGNPDIRIIFVGDVDQLPSIGPGKFFEDILNNIKELNFKACQLIEIMRQNDEELKKTISSFKDGIEILPDEHSGFKFIKHCDKTYEKDIEKLLNDERKERIKIDEKYKDDEKWCQELFENFQLLSPQKDGITGVKDVNRIIQRYLWKLGHYKGDPFLCNYEGQIYNIGDKIINIKNDYDSEPPIFNGQIGMILGKEEDEISVQFNGRKEVYKYEDVNELKFKSKLAHCVSIHKSQGSGFENVILFINDHSSMWPSNGRPLLYTGASRTKKKLWLIGSEKTIIKAKKSKDNTFTTLFRHKEYYDEGIFS